jgi:subtilisin-like proprotein convertase family protein
MSKRTKLVAGALAALALAVPASASATTGTFTSTTPVAIPDGGSAPASNIVVSGLPGLTNDVNVSLTNLSHKRVTDLDALLVAPNGAGGTVLLSDAGDTTDVLDATLGFDDSALTTAPAPLVAGTYKPTDVNTGADTYPVAGPYGATLASVNGFNPNGTWSLYLVDDDNTVDGADASTGDIEGWSLTVSTNSDGQPPTATNPNAGPKPKKAQKPKKCKPKHGRGSVHKKPKKCKPKHRGLKKGHRS